MRKLLLSLALVGIAVLPVRAAPVGLPMPAAVAVPGQATVQLAQYSLERRQAIRRQELRRRQAIQRARLRRRQAVRRGY